MTFSSNKSLTSSKRNSVQFEDPYDNIHHMEKNNGNTHLIDTKEQDMENNGVKKDEFHYKKNDELIPE